jgi:hypothetical protein
MIPAWVISIAGGLLFKPGFGPHLFADLAKTYYFAHFDFSSAMAVGLVIVLDEWLQYLD